MVIDHSEMPNINLPDVQQGWRGILCTQTELDVQLFSSCLSTVRGLQCNTSIILNQVFQVIAL